MKTDQKRKDVRIVFCSDIHIGNTRIDAVSTHLNMKGYIYPKLTECDLLLFGGDFFDRSLKLDDPSSFEAITTIREIIDLSHQHKFKIRVLRGTFSHDRRQNAIFKHTLANDTGVDLVCVDTVSLEYIRELDLRVLYLPDNLPYRNREEVMDVVHDLLATYGWETVDIVSGHGYFEHVLPKGASRLPPLMYDFMDFKDIVEGYVLMGHVHTTSVYENVIYAGSFERLQHGEEEAKGFYTVCRKDNVWSYEFHENKDAELFKTIELYGEDITMLQQKVCELVDIFYNKDRGGYLRISHSSPEIRQILAQVTHEKYPNITVTVKNTKETKETRQLIKEFQTYTYTTPTRENLPSLILDFLKCSKKDTVLTKEKIQEVLLL